MAESGQQANLFELSRGKISVTYSSTSITGQPQFNYRDATTNRNFMGEEIQIEKTSIGQLTTVTLEHVPDLRIVRFSLLLPEVNVTKGSAGTRVEVPAVRTTLHTTLGGPPPGPNMTYEGYELKGTAQFVIF